MDGFPIPKVKSSVKLGLSYRLKYDRCKTCNMSHITLRSYRSFIEWNDVLRLCISCASSFFACLRGLEQTSMEVSVSKTPFIPQILRNLITEWLERFPQRLWSMRSTVMTVQRMLHNHCRRRWTWCSHYPFRAKECGNSQIVLLSRVFLSSTRNNISCWKLE